MQACSSSREGRVVGKLSFISLYSGSGGLDHGFTATGLFEPVWANDIDEHAVQTYTKAFDHWGHVATSGDIRRQPDLPGRGSADLVIGGPPCQGFSVAGRMDPEDPRSRHVWDFLRMVERVRPRAFVMENVASLAVNRRWASLRDALVRHASKGLGYTTSLVLLNASHYGVPQARERMFLIGLHGRWADHPVVPMPSTLRNSPTVRSAIERLPPVGEPGNATVCTARITPAKKPVLRRSPFAGMLFNGQGRPLDLDMPALTLPASMGGNRTPIIDQQQLEQGGECWVVEYHRRLWAGADPIDRIPDRLRRITVEEAAEIQTFPTGMEWVGPQSAKYRQIGNAVPPRLAEAVAQAVASALGLSEPPAPPEGIDVGVWRDKITLARGLP